MRVAGMVAVLLAATAAPAAADDSKLAKDGISATGKSPGARGKMKLCCGYPLSETQGFRYTYYWMADEDRHDNSRRWGHIPDFVHDRQDLGLANDQIDLYTREGDLLGTFTESFVKELRMEGSGWLADGRTVNYAGRCRYGIGICFEFLDPRTHPYGRGAGRRPLEPWRSVAVDRRLIPIGDTIYVPEFDGLRLPDGNVHDGCLRADDTGGAIRKRLIDFFVAELENFMWVNEQMWFDRYFTPHIEDPRCDYLRDADWPPRPRP